MKNLKLKYLMVIVFLLLTNALATTDSYMVERNTIKDLFVNSCFGGYVGKKVEIHFEGYCRCVWDKASLEFTNKELDYMNQQKEPYYTDFLTTMKTKANACAGRYLAPVQGQF